MAAIQSWREQLPKSYVGARKWGTGINPIHSQRTSKDVGRNLAPGAYNGAELERLGLTSEDYGYTTEDDMYVGEPASLAYLRSHPGLGDSTKRGQADYPSWGRGRDPLPGGTGLRALKRSVPDNELNAPQPYGNGPEGWTNKYHGDVLESRVADESQLYVRTSMRQLRETQTNDRSLMRGTDEPRSSIATRLTGMKVKNWPGGKRHEEMEPREQFYMPRPFLQRNAGTGPTSWMIANEQHDIQPLTRHVPTDVYQGLQETSPELLPDDFEDSYDDGW